MEATQRSDGDTTVRRGLVEHHLAHSDEVLDGGRLVLSIAGLELGIFRVQGSIKVYENRCLHQGGPVCQGKIVPRVEEVIDRRQKSRGYRFSETKTHIVCPWHGFEYDLQTGEHPGKAAIRLRGFKAFERDGEIYAYL